LPISCNNETSKPTNEVILAEKKPELNIYGMTAQQTMGHIFARKQVWVPQKTVVIIQAAGLGGDKNDVNGLCRLIQRALPDHAVGLT
jgi:hypothetical protein